MPDTREIFSLTKGEIIRLKKSDLTKSLLIYYLGLPVIFIVLTLIMGHSSAFFGFLLIGVCFMNVFYAPRQFSFNKEVQNKVSPGSFIRSGLLTLWSFNLPFLLFLPILIIMKFDKEEITLFISYFIYCFGFVSPLGIFFSGSLIKSGVHVGKIKSFAIQVAIVLLPLLPLPVVLLANSHQIFIMKAFGLSGVIVLLLTPLILKITERRISTSK